MVDEREGRENGGQARGEGEWWTSERGGRIVDEREGRQNGGRKGGERERMAKEKK